jgi:hypothetical protein
MRALLESESGLTIVQPGRALQTIILRSSSDRRAALKYGSVVSLVIADAITMQAARINTPTAAQISQNALNWTSELTKV